MKTIYLCGNLCDIYISGKTLYMLEPSLIDWSDVTNQLDGSLTAEHF